MVSALCGHGSGGTPALTRPADRAGPAAAVVVAGCANRLRHDYRHHQGGWLALRSCWCHPGGHGQGAPRELPHSTPRRLSGRRSRTRSKRHYRLPLDFRQFLLLSGPQGQTRRRRAHHHRERELGRLQTSRHQNRAIPRQLRRRQLCRPHRWQYQRPRTCQDRLFGKIRQ